MQDVCRLLDLACWVNMELGEQWQHGGGIPRSLVALAQGYCHRILRYSRGAAPFMDKRRAAQPCHQRGCPGCRTCTGDSAVASQTNVPDLQAQALLVLRAAQALCASGPAAARSLAWWRRCCGWRARRAAGALRAGALGALLRGPGQRGGRHAGGTAARVV